MRWFQLHPKVKAALGLGITAVGASAVSAWDGKTTWHDTIGVAIGALVAVIGGYFASPESPDA